MSKNFISIILVLILATATFTLHAQAETIYFTVDGNPYFPQYTQTPIGYAIPAQTINGSSWQVSITGVVDIDPFISFGFTATNIDSAPHDFGFMFFPGVPILMPSGPTLLKSSIVGGLTDSTGDGVSISPATGNTMVSDNYLSLNPTNPIIWSVGPAVTFAQGEPGSFYNYGAFAFSGPGPDGPFTDILFGEKVLFTLSGYGDIAALTGYCSINPVPLPGAALLLGSGLLGLVGWRRFRKS